MSIRETKEIMMAVDRANIEIGTNTEVRKALMAFPMNDRPHVQSVVNIAVKAEKKRILDEIKKAVNKK